MNKKQLQDLILWLRDKLSESESIIKESKITHNYGRATQFEGMRDAYLECLRKINLDKIA
jgi:hypothetical protein